MKRNKVIRRKPARSDAGAAGKDVTRQSTPVRAVPRAAPPNVELVVRHFERRRKLSEQKRLYLRVGDKVMHLRYDEWGLGVVMEIMTSSVPGGTCLVRIRFEDGQMRCFNNDLDNEGCCYYFGVRRSWNPKNAYNGIRAKFFEMKG